MDSLTTKIAFYEKRPFVKKADAVFGFIKENWKVMLKYTTYLILPLCLLQAVGSNIVSSRGMQLQAMFGSGNAMNLTALDASFYAGYALLILSSLLGSTLLASLIYTLLAVYNETPEHLAGTTLARLKPRMIVNFKRILLLNLFSFGMLLLYITLAAAAASFAGLSTLLISVPLLIACTVPLFLFTPLYAFEEIGLLKALSKSFRLGIRTWGGTFAMILMMSIFAILISLLTSIPWYTTTFVQYFYTTSDAYSPTNTLIGYQILLYLSTVLQVFGSYLGMILLFLGAAYQYAHACKATERA